MPHEKTITKWYQTNDCQPGFPKEAVDAMRKVVEKEKAKGRKAMCEILFDEVHIRSDIQEARGKEYGIPIIGKPKEGVEGATEILTFMAVFHDDEKTKIPFGYFPSTGSVDAKEKAQLIIKAITTVQETEAKVLGLTFDGAAVNFTSMDELGAKLDEETSTYSIIVNGEEIYIYPDPSHMVKNVRNTLAKYQLVDGQGRIIKFEYFEKLLNLQEKFDFKMNTKLTSQHIFFSNKPMNVRLAVQLFSNSVANQLERCLLEKVPGFEDCAATIEFSRWVNDIFDVCNSQSLEAPG